MQFRMKNSHYILVHDQTIENRYQIPNQQQILKIDINIDIRYRHKDQQTDYKVRRPKVRKMNRQIGQYILKFLEKQEYEQIKKNLGWLAIGEWQKHLHYWNVTITCLMTEIFIK